VFGAVLLDDESLSPPLLAVLSAGAVDATLLHGTAAVDVMVYKAFAEEKGHAEQHDGQGHKAEGEQQDVKHEPDAFQLFCAKIDLFNDWELKNWRKIHGIYSFLVIERVLVGIFCITLYQTSTNIAEKWKRYNWNLKLCSTASRK
jgi:hypothetical protein